LPTTRFPLSTDTTNLGLKDIVARNATKLIETDTKKKNTKKTSKTKLEYYYNSLKYTQLYVHTLISNKSSFTELH
jgi:hypothetical protein